MNAQEREHTWGEWFTASGGHPAYTTTHGQLRHCTECRAFQWRTVDLARRIVLDVGRVHPAVSIAS